MAKEKQQKSAPKKNAPAKERRQLHPIRFLKEVVAELKKVSWPSRKDLISYSLAVMAFVALISVVVGVLDFIFQQGFMLIIQ